MKQFYLTSKLGIALFLFLCSNVFSQIPDGGIQLNATTGTTYQRIGSGTLTTVQVTDQPFTTALRLVVPSNINNTWDSQIKFPSIGGIEPNDIVLVAFYARVISSILETGEGQLNVIIEHNTTYAKDLSHKMNIGSEWKQYYAPVKCVSNLPTAQVTYAFHTGFPSQTIEVADVKFLNYKQNYTLEEMPVTEITYSGQAPDADWRAPAQERINQIRKGDMDIIVYDEQGQKIENAEVSIEMIRHQFGFGSAIPANRFMTNAAFREKVYELFNEVVFENDLKWGSFNPFSNINIRNSLDSLDKYEIPVRGHNVIWPAWRWIPASIKQLENDPVALRLAIDKRIDEVTLFAKGRLNDWDVLNEPYSEKDIMAILGNEVMADWFKRTRQNDRSAKLYINDYGILSGGGINTVKQDYYYNIVQYIDNLGGGIDGIGFQGHFGGDLTPINRVYSIIDRFAELGKDIKITEHDINITQRGVQTDYTRDFMTIVFSHEAVKSFLFWGFWESSHWMPNAALYDTDWTIRPHGEMYKEMVFNEWWTKKTEGTTDEEGKVSFEGFLGTYQFTVKHEGQERTGTFKLDNSRKSELPNVITISLDDEIPVQAYITSSIPAVLCQGETITLNAPTGEGLSYAWYRGEELLSDESASIETTLGGVYTVKVSKGLIEVVSPPFEVIVNQIPEAELTAEGSLAICPGGQVKLNANVSNDLTYTWKRGTTTIHGSVTSINANTAGTYTVTTNYKGCTAVSDPVVVEVLSADECETGMHEIMDTFRVYPNPFKSSFILETGNVFSGYMTVELIDTLGKIVFSTQVDPSEEKLVIPASTPGFYTLKVRMGEDIKVFKIIGR